VVAGLVNPDRVKDIPAFYPKAEAALLYIPEKTKVFPAPSALSSVATVLETQPLEQVKIIFEGSEGNIT
jgi:hypothetical protein